MLAHPPPLFHPLPQSFSLSPFLPWLTEPSPRSPHFTLGTSVPSQDGYDNPKEKHAPLASTLPRFPLSRWPSTLTMPAPPGIGDRIGRGAGVPVGRDKEKVYSSS